MCYVDILSASANSDDATRPRPKNVQNELLQAFPILAMSIPTSS